MLGSQSISVRSFLPGKTVEHVSGKCSVRLRQVWPRHPTLAPRNARSDALEHDHRDLSIRPLLVLVVVRPLPRSELPEPLTLVADRGARPGGKDIALHLELHPRLLDEVPVPARVLACAEVRRADHIAVTRGLVDPRRRARLAGLSALGREQEDLRP